MDLNLIEPIRKNLEDYFNGPLKESLNSKDDLIVELGDNYNIFIVKSVQRNIIPTENFMPVLPSTLFPPPFNNIHNLEQLEKILEEIRKSILNALRLHINVRDVLILVETYANKVVIELLFEPFQLEEIPDVGIYSNIAINLSERELNELCRSDKKFVKLCRSTQFWNNLLMKKFPNYVFTNIKNPEQLYKGLLYYNKNMNKINLATLYPITFIYLMKNGIISKEIIKKNISYLFENININTLNEIYNSYPNIFTASRLELLNDIVVSREMDNSFDKFKWIKDKQGIILTDKDLLNLLQDLSNFALVDDIFHYLKDKLSSNEIFNLILNAITDQKIELVRTLYYPAKDKLSKEHLENLFEEMLAVI